MLGARKLMTAIVAAAAVAACSGGDDGGTEPTPAISIALSSATLSVTQGTTGTVSVNLTRSGGFSGEVAVTVEGLPGTVNFTASPTTIGSTATSTTLTFGAAGTAAPGVINATIRATGTGVTAATAPLAITVVAAPTPSFTMSVAPATLSVAQGASGTSTVTLTRTNFTGAVALTAENLPTGVTAAFDPASVTGTTSTLTLTAAASAATGAATITVRGTGTGVTAQTATITLTVTAPAAGGFTLSMNPATLSVTQGANGTSTVNITRTGGFAGSVNLTASGLPTGVTAAFNPADATGNSSTLTLTASATATTGAATVTIKGTSAGQTDQTTTLALTVNGAQGYTLAMNPTTLSIAQGASGTSTVNITRTNGFAGAVTLTATGLPNGVTAAFNPTAPTTNSSTLTLTASATAAVGQATVTVHGAATGLAEQTATLTLNVTASSGGSGNTSWEFCTVDQTPIWVAVQDGANGTWTRVTPSGPNNTRFQFNITQSKGAIAYVTTSASASVGTGDGSFASRLSKELQQMLLERNRPTRSSAYAARSLADNYTLNIFYGTQAELNLTGTTRCLTGSGKTVNGSVAGLSGATTSSQSATVSLGPSEASASPQQLTFQLKDVPDGALDLIAGRSTTTISGTDVSIALDKLIIRRGVNAAANSTLPVLDFGSAEAFDPVQANLTIANLNSDVAWAVTSYYTANGSGVTGASLAGFSLPGSGPFKYYGVPSNKQVAGDLHVAIAFAIPSLTSADQSRFAALYFKDPTDRTLTLGAAFPAPTVTTPATTPYARFRAQGTLPTEYNQALVLSYTQETASRTVGITASQNYLAGASTYDFTIPDFTSAAGWDNNWGPKSGSSTMWSVTGYAFTGSFNTATPTEGSTFKGATRSGTITP